MGLAVIPIDWTEGYIELCIKWPNSEQWLAVLRGQLTAPNEAEFWDKFTGDTEEPKVAIGPTFDQNLHLEECMTFQTGMIMMWPLETPPIGWLSFNGQFVSKVTYPELWTFLGDFFGETEFEFQVGPTSGAFPVGWDAESPFANPLNNYGGEAEHITTVGEMPIHNHTQDSHNHTQDSHNHTQNSHNHTQNSHLHTQQTATATGSYATTQNFVGPSYTQTNTGSTTAINQEATAINQAATATNQAATATNQAAGGGEAHNNLPPFFVTNFIIKT